MANKRATALQTVLPQIIRTAQKSPLVGKIKF